MKNKIVLSIVLTIGLINISFGQIKKYEFKSAPFKLFPKNQFPKQDSSKLFPKDLDKFKYTPPQNFSLKPPSQVYQNSNMAILLLKNEKQKIGNNGKGFDIYRAELDGMPIAVPDNTNINR